MLAKDGCELKVSPHVNAIYSRDAIVKNKHPKHEIPNKKIVTINTIFTIKHNKTHKVRIVYRGGRGR